MCVVLWVCEQLKHNETFCLLQIITGVEKQGPVGSLVDCTSEGAALEAILVKIIRVSMMMMIIRGGGAG